jgi:DNA-binding NarL/FixJ family response regulator
MPRSNIETVGRLIDAWNQRDLQAALKAMHPQCEVRGVEASVALAVARGAKNREVAAELYLSPKTIEFHLGRVYRKLGIHSRAELATVVAQGGLESEPDRAASKPR